MSLAPEGVTTSVLESPTAAEMLEALHNFDAFHLVCHAYFNSWYPSRNHLMFRSDLGQAKKLTAGR